MDTKQYIATLKNTELFKQVPDEVLNAIAEKITVTEFKAGETVFKEGDEGNGLYIVVSGTVNIVKQNIVITELEKESFFGELALIDNAPRAASAIAQTATTLLFLDRDTFNHIFSTMPQVSDATMRVVMRYLRRYTTAE